MPKHHCPLKGNFVETLFPLTLLNDENKELKTAIVNHESKDACKLKNAEQATMIGMQSIQQIKRFVFVSLKSKSFSYKHGSPRWIEKYKFSIHLVIKNCFSCN